MDKATAELIECLSNCDPHDTDEVIKHLNAAARELQRLGRNEDERSRLVAMVEQWNEFITLVDGYVYYWPNPERAGALSACNLRMIAEELDRRNDKWDHEVRQALEEIDRREQGKRRTDDDRGIENHGTGDGGPAAP